MTISVEKVGADARAEVECFYLCELRREVTLAPELTTFVSVPAESPYETWLSDATSVVH